MRRNIDVTIVLAIAAFVSTAAPLHAQAKFEVGSHTACLTTGCIDTVTHSMGIQPVAMIVWSDGKTNSSWGGNYAWSFGFTDGVTHQVSSAGSQNNLGSTTLQAASRRGASTLIQLIQGAASGIPARLSESH